MSWLWTPRGLIITFQASAHKDPCRSRCSVSELHEGTHLAALFGGAAFVIQIAADGQKVERCVEGGAEGGGDSDVVGIEVAEEDGCHAVLAGAGGDCC